MTAFVHQRHVLYFTGFDPKGPAHYHRLYEQQAQLQSSLKGYRITVGSRNNHSISSTTWNVHFHMPTENVSINTCYEFARWDDVVRHHWTKHYWQVARNTLKTSWDYARQGIAWHFLKKNWPAFLALFMPASLLVLAIVFTGFGIAFAAKESLQGINLGVCVLALILWICSILLVLGIFENRFHMSWLMRSFHFTRENILGRAPDLQERLDLLAEHIAHLVTTSKADEILLVGHSTGGGMAVSALARAWERHQEKISPESWSKVSLLTLGQWFPLLSLMREAAPMRHELLIVAKHFHAQWVDISAPADGCCTALVDPLDAVRSLELLECPSPKLLSPRFQKMFSPKDYRALKRDRFRLHFQYLMASPIAELYDYFFITAGPQRLASIFADQSSVVDFKGLNFPLFRKCR